jgi:hypothetical protein
VAQQPSAIELVITRSVLRSSSKSSPALTRSSNEGRPAPRRPKRRFRCPQRKFTIIAGKQRQKPALGSETSPYAIEIIIFQKIPARGRTAESKQPISGINRRNRGTAGELLRPHTSRFLDSSTPPNTRYSRHPHRQLTGRWQIRPSNLTHSQKIP